MWMGQIALNPEVQEFTSEAALQPVWCVLAVAELFGYVYALSVLRLYTDGVHGSATKLRHASSEARGGQHPELIARADNRYQALLASL
jgi:hypothetical protein